MKCDKNPLGPADWTSYPRSTDARPSERRRRAVCRHAYEEPITLQQSKLLPVEAPARRASDDGALRRSEPELYIIDAERRIVLASGADDRTFDEERAQLWNVVDNVLADGPIAELTSAIAGSSIVRIFPMVGSPDARYCVLVERRRTRTSLVDACAKYGLTAREIDVLRLMLAGMSTSAIAGKLFIAETTAADHIKHIAAKTDSRNRAQVVARVLGA